MPGESDVAAVPDYSKGRMKYWGIRVLSFVLFVGLIGGTWYIAGASGLSLLVVVFIIGNLTPIIGDFAVTPFILWTGHSKRQCARCMALDYPEYDIETHECDWCGERWQRTTLQPGPIRYHPANTDTVYEYCSMSCSNAHQNSMGATA